MEDLYAKSVSNSGEIIEYIFSSLEAEVNQQISHIAMSFDEFIHLQSKDRVS